MGPVRGSHRLLLLMAGLSLGVHLVAFAHLGGLLKGEGVHLSAITLVDDPDEQMRQAPRPRVRPACRAPEVGTPPQAWTPAPLPVPTAPQRVSPALAGESRALPCPSVVGNPGGAAAAEGGPAAGDYLELVRLRIEAVKRYPDEARRAHTQGRVQLGLQLDASGVVTALKVLAGSGSPLLDRAAREAVLRASPFPAPPLSAPGGAVRLEVGIVFELT